MLGVHCDGAMRERMILPAHKLHVCNALGFEQLALVETRREYWSAAAELGALMAGQRVRPTEGGARGEMTSSTASGGH